MEEETKLETPEEKARRKERERFMRQAITQAKKAEKLMEVPIGCVIVYEGKVIARGYNRRNTDKNTLSHACLLYTSPSPRDQRGSRMPSSA